MSQEDYQINSQEMTHSFQIWCEVKYNFKKRSEHKIVFEKHNLSFCSSLNSGGIVQLVKKSEKYNGQTPAHAEHHRP